MPCGSGAMYTLHRCWVCVPFITDIYFFCSFSHQNSLTNRIVFGRRQSYVNGSSEWVKDRPNRFVNELQSKLYWRAFAWGCIHKKKTKTSFLDFWQIEIPVLCNLQTRYLKHCLNINKLWIKNLTGAEVRAGTASWRIELNFSLSPHCGSEFNRKRHSLLYELYISLKEYLLLWTLLVWSLRGCNVYKNLSKIYNIHPMILVL